MLAFLFWNISGSLYDSLFRSQLQTALVESPSKLVPSRRSVSQLLCLFVYSCKQTLSLKDKTLVLTHHYVWCLKLSFSVHQCQNESWNKSFGWSKKRTALCFARQAGHSGLIPSKLCPKLGKDNQKFYSICPKKVWSARWTFLLMGEVNGESTLSSFRSNWSGVFMLVVCIP